MWEGCNAPLYGEGGVVYQIFFVIYPRRFDVL
jgi:hypothetical protein